MRPRPSPFLLVAAVATAAPAIAASPFDGTWKADMATIKLSDKPETLLLAGGTYSCKTCTPPVTVPADGRFHPVAGQDYVDALAVTVTGPKAVTIRSQKGGRTIAVVERTVSADGRTLTVAAKRTNPVTGVVASGTTVATRVGAAPAGAHAISGSWRDAAVHSVSESATTQTIAIVGDVLTLSTPGGEGYAATLGGPPVPQKNDVGHTMVTVKRLAPNRIVETDMRGGKVVQTYDMTVAPGGRTMTMVIADTRAGGSETVTLVKQ